MTQRTYEGWYEEGEVFSYGFPPWMSTNSRFDTVPGPSCILWQRFNNYTAG